MKFRTVVILLSCTVVFGLLLCSFPAAATPPESSPVGSSDAGAVTDDQQTEPELPQVTLNFRGMGCDTNLNESELLRVKGVIGVDIESKPGKVIVTYDPAQVGVAKIVGAVGRKKGGCAASEEVAGSKK